MSMNPPPNHASGSGSIIALKAECLGNLKALMAGAGCKEGSVDSRGCL